MKVRIIGEDAVRIHDVGDLKRTRVMSASLLSACFRFVFSGGLDERAGDSEGREETLAFLFPEASRPTGLLHAKHPQKVRGLYLMARGPCIG